MSYRIQRPKARLLLLSLCALAVLMLIMAFPLRTSMREARPALTSFNRFFAYNARYIRKAMEPNPEVKGFYYNHLRRDPYRAGRSLEQLLAACWSDDAYCTPLVTCFLQASGVLSLNIPFPFTNPDACRAIERLNAPVPLPLDEDEAKVLCVLSRKNLLSFPRRLRAIMAELLAGSQGAADSFAHLRRDIDPRGLAERLSNEVHHAEDDLPLALEKALKQAVDAVPPSDMACAWFSLLDYCDCLDRLIGRLHEALGPVDAKSLPAGDDFPPGLFYVSNTEHGTVLVGGPEDNIYPAKDAFLIIDLGGNDTYLFDQSLVSGTLDVERTGCGTIVDLGGDDFYVGGPGSVASGILGFHSIVDLEGNDLYRTQAMGVGSGFMGLGLLIDAQGDDGYVTGPFSLGAAVHGAGIVIDDQGDDVYKAGSLSQGFAGPLGLGCLIDSAGYDMYASAGTSGSGKICVHGYSQACFLALDRLGEESGVALLLDLDGDDRYHCDVAGQGAALGRGLALLLDARGYDIYHGRTRCQGFGSMGGFGLLRDLDGCDFYSASSPAQGMGSLASIGFLVDDRGDDLYTVLPNAERNSLFPGTGMLLDADGRDRFLQSALPDR